LAALAESEAVCDCGQVACAPALPGRPLAASWRVVRRARRGETRPVTAPTRGQGCRQSGKARTAGGLELFASTYTI